MPVKKWGIVWYLFRVCFDMFPVCGFMVVLFCAWIRGTYTFFVDFRLWRTQQRQRCGVVDVLTQKVRNTCICWVDRKW